MNKTKVKVALWLASIVSVCAYSAGLPRAQDSGLNGLDADRMGRIAGTPVHGTGTVIAPAAMAERSESPVARAAGVALAPPPPGVIADKLLAGEIAAKFEPLEVCRIDVARGKQVRARDVAAEPLILRWTIQPTGRVTAAEVVATTVVDAEVLDCVKRRMNEWTFSRPSGGPLPVERVLRFRSAPPQPAHSRASD
jgi:hypothetical protein